MDRLVLQDNMEKLDQKDRLEMMDHEVILVQKVRLLLYIFKCKCLEINSILLINVTFKLW